MSHCKPMPPEIVEMATLGFARLTTREREVLDYVIDGNSSKETAKKLRISPRTVEVHRSKIMLKLGARNTVEIVRLAFAQSN